MNFGGDPVRAAFKASDHIEYASLKKFIASLTLLGFKEAAEEIIEEGLE